MQEIRKLKMMGACDEAIKWLEKQESYEQAWRDCPRGDWMLWLLHEKLDGSDAGFRKFVLAKARCAKTVFHLMKDERSKNGVLVAERFGIGDATIEELKSAASAAHSAANSADVYGYVYADACGAAVYADACGAAAYAARAAAADTDDAVCAAAAAAAYAEADTDDAVAAAAARKENQKKCADLIRELYIEEPKL